MLKILFISISIFLTSTPSISADEIGSFWRAKKTTVDNNKAKVGDVFKINQLISTGKSSRAKAEITTVDNSRYILYKNSSIKFEELDMSGSICNGMKVTLTQGKIRGTSGSCGHGKTEIKTAVAAAFAWGTDYEMMFLPEGKKIPGYENIEPGFYQKVNEGKVMVSNDSGSLLIHPGEAGFVSVSGVAPTIIPLPDFFTNTKKPAPIKQKKKPTKEKTPKPKKQAKTKADQPQKKSNPVTKKKPTKEKSPEPKETTKEEKSEAKTKVTSKPESTEPDSPEPTEKVQDQSSDSEDTITEQPADDNIGEDVESEIIETTPDNDIDSGEPLIVEKVINDDSNDITITTTVTPEITIPQKDTKGGVTTEIKIISSFNQDSEPIITTPSPTQTLTTTETYNVDIYDDGSTKKTLAHITEETTVLDEGGGWILQGVEYNGDNVIGWATPGTPTTTNQIKQTYHYQTVQRHQDRIKSETTTTKIKFYTPSDNTTPYTTTTNTAPPVHTDQDTQTLPNDKDITNIVYVLLEGKENDLKAHLDIFGVDQVISGDNASLFEVDPATGDGTNDQIRLKSSNIYDDLFDPILNQTNPVELEIDITSENQLTDLQVTTKYKFRLTDKRSEFGSMVTVSTPKTYVAPRQILSEIITPRLKTLIVPPSMLSTQPDGYQSEENDTDLLGNSGQVLTTNTTSINNESSTIHYGIAQTSDVNPVKMVYIYERQSNDLSTENGSLGMKLPKSAIIEYVIHEESKSPMLLNNSSTTGTEITNDYSLSGVSLGIDFSRDEDNVRASIKIEDADNNTTIISKEVVTTLTTTYGHNTPTTIITGQFSGTTATYNSTDIDHGDKRSKITNYGYQTHSDLTISGALMGNNGSHIGLGYSMAIEIDSLSDPILLVSGTVLLRADSSSPPPPLESDRQDSGSLIMMKKTHTTFKAQQTELLSLTPYGYDTDNSTFSQATDAFTSEINSETNLTKNLFYCESGVDCDYDQHDYSVLTTKKITYSEIPGNFEDNITINAGTTSESNVHWGWWQDPDRATSIEADDIVNSAIHSTPRFVFFMYEDLAEKANDNGEMHLPTEGITIYDVLDKSKLTINSEAGEVVTDEYWLDSATLEIDFGTNKLDTSLKIAHRNDDSAATSKDMNGIDQFVDFIDSMTVDVDNNGRSDFDNKTGRFAVNQGFFHDKPTNSYNRPLTSGQTAFDSAKDVVYTTGKGSFSVAGAMMGVDGSHAGMGYTMAVKNATSNSHDDVVSGMVLFKAQ